MQKAEYFIPSEPLFTPKPELQGFGVKIILLFQA